MNYLLLAVQITLSVVLLLAATGKALRSEEFAAALRLSRLPAALIAPVSVGVPTLELGLAFALVFSTPRSLLFAMGMTVALLGVFTAWMGWVLTRRLHLRCGCFGTGSAEIGPYSIVRNGLLLLIAIGGLVLASRTPSSLPGPSVPLAITVTALGMGFVLLLAARAGLPGLFLTQERIEARRADAQRMA